ncbi:hypothetical protein ABIF86_000253 [Bradyrhizobium japonicum]
MGEAECRRDRHRFPLRVEQRIEAAIAIRLQDTGEGGQMLLGMLAPSVARGVIDRRRRRRPTVGLIVAHIMRWTVPTLISCKPQPKERAQAMMMMIGLDISKSWFQIHLITKDGEIVRKKLARGKVLDFFSRLPSCLVGLEAYGQCSSLGS